MAQEQVNTELMETIRWGIGLIIGGLAGLGVYLWRLATKLTSHDKDIEGLKEDHDKDFEQMKRDVHEIRNNQQLKDVKFNELIEKLEETKEYLAEENRKNSDNMRSYFDKKYTILETRIYDLKK